MSSMLAAMFYAPLDVRLEQRPIPQPGAGEVLLKVAAATTCGTDVKAYLRGHPLLFRQTPAGFGHEVAGVVAAAGAGVTQCAEGDAVVVANSAPCRQCFYCRRGNFSLCEDLLLLNGALACSLHGIDASAIVKGDTVVVLGAGPLGLLLTATAKLKGARVIITGRGMQRLSLAHRFGADVVIDVSQVSFQEQREAVLKETGAHRGADVVIEAIGTPATWELATMLARPGGLVNFFGGCASGTRVNLETRSLHYSELTLKGVFHHTPAYASILDVLELLVQKRGVKYALIPPDFQQTLGPVVAPQ